MQHDWNDAFGLNQEKKPDYFDRPLIKILFPAGTLLVAVITLLSTSSNLAPWALAVLVGFVIICGLILLWPALAWCLGHWRARIRRNRAARLFYPEVEQTIRRLHEHLGESTSHTLVYELRDFTSIRDKTGNPVISSLAEATNIKEWLAIVARRASKRKSQDFVDVAQGASLAASQYRHLCESLQNHLQYLVNQNLLDEAHLRKLKNCWNSARDSYASMMQDWAKTCDKLNSELGDYVGPSHFVPLRTLE